jgi:hypothetical protein
MAIYQATSWPSVALQCVVCTKGFEHVVKGRGRYPRYCCGNCRTESLRRAGRKSAARRKGLTLPQPWQRRCVECRTMFATTCSATICCGVQCGNARGKRLGDETRTANANHRRTRRCEICERLFVMRNPSGQARVGLSREGRFCSRACADDARRRFLIGHCVAKCGTDRDRASARRIGSADLASA